MKLLVQERVAETSNVPDYIYQELPVQLLVVDHDYQRNLMPTKVEIIAKNFDPRAVGVLIVHKRSDGTFVVLDGQHRLGGMKIAGVTMAPCKVCEGLTKKEEAEIFIKYNTVRANPNALNAFRANITAEDEDTLKIKEIVERNGHRINFNNSGNTAYGISAVSALIRVYNGGGEEALDEVIKIINKAWLGEKDALQGMIIYGLYRFINAYKNEPAFDRNKMLRKLQGIPVIALIRKARGYAKLLDGSVATNIARSILESYNQNSSSRRLPDKFSNVAQSTEG